MSYTALYRKFRPSDLSQVRGQDHIVVTLRNQLLNSRVGHAYLFTGTRGTGKTSIAKIMARAVNCEHPTENGPCGECDSCRAIADGSSLNVFEIDAASNTGVDNVRVIIDGVNYRHTMGKYKYENLGIDYKLKNLDDLDGEKAKRAAEIFRRTLSCKVIV